MTPLLGTPLNFDDHANAAYHKSSRAGNNADLPLASHPSDCVCVCVCVKEASQDLASDRTRPLQHITTQNISRTWRTPSNNSKGKHYSRIVNTSAKHIHRRVINKRSSTSKILEINYSEM